MADIFELFRQIGSKTPEKAKPVTWLLVGLGNPGEQYTHTRHNAGFSALDSVAKRHNVKIDRLKYHALTGEGEIDGVGVLFLKPQTFMNASGTAVAEASDFYHIPPEHILVLSDDITQKVGRMRVRKKGSAGGHNGLKDIIRMVGSENFPRIRLGVGEKPHPDYDLADWVLSEFSAEERKTLTDMAETIDRGVSLILSDKTDDAIALCNGYGAKESEKESK